MAAGPRMSQKTLEQLSIHVFFPRFLPNEKSHQLHLEESLAEMMYTTIANINETAPLPPSTLKLFANFVKIHPLVDANTISEEIKYIRSGEMLGMFVRHQNCGLIFYRPSNYTAKSSNDDLIIATFPVWLETTQIHQSNGDLQLDYPTQSLKVQLSSLLGSTAFATQICYLNTVTLPDANTSTQYVSKWLVAALANRTSLLTDKNEFPSITKKVRDEVIGTFQRSGCWMALKVMLQLNLSVEFGEQIGRFIYKFILLELHTNLCDSFNSNSITILNIDLMGQILAKMARRIEKLILLGDSIKSFGELSTLYDNVIANAKSVISRTRNKIDRQIKTLEWDDERKARLTPLKYFDFQADIHQQIPNLEKYLEMRDVKCKQGDYDGGIIYTPYSRHHYKSKHKPEIDTFSKLTTEIETNLYLSDYENWFLYVLTFDEGEKWHPTELRENYFNYSSKAEPFYSEDPFGSSKMLLVRFKILAILDKIGTREHPLLQRHRTGINSNVFNNLLLSNTIDMKIAFELQIYFKKRNTAASAPALIEERNVTCESFAVNYAAANEKMQNIRQQIQQMAERKIEEKQVEWERLRLRVEEMRQQAEEMVDSKEHRALKKRINEAKIALYVRPLPTKEYRQNAVVFELDIPIEIECLRDVLCKTVKSISSATGALHIYEKWISYDQISSYNQSKSKKVVDLVNNTEQVNKRNKRKKHVDESFDNFIVENGYNCVYGCDGTHLPTNIDEQSVKTLCTLCVEKGSAYQELQWTLMGTNHTQNQVIAMQAECAVTLWLAEYKNFGSLRADGHRLQLRKLYGMIETEALSFGEPSVLSLVLQTIYENGPDGECTFHRESHEDFTDPAFVTEMIKLLDKFIDKQKCSWKHPLKLMMVTLITVRVFEFNLNKVITKRIVCLLQKLREICVDWIKKIQIAMQEANGCPSEENLLRDKLIEVAIAGACTFLVHPSHKLFSKIFSENRSNGFSAVRMWLEVIVTINNNILLSDKATKDRRVFLRLVRNIGIRIETKIISLIKNNPSAVYNFIESQWSQSKNGNFARCNFSAEQSQVLIVENDKNRIIIDIITGDFRVKNQPVARLSKKIVQSKVYRRVFNEFVFEVQPGKLDTFCTKHKYNECYYDFFLNPKGEIVITERREDGSKYELVPHIFLQNDVTYLLVENYSHWWNKTTKVIEFRPKSFIDSNFTSPSGIEYKLDLNTHRLVHCKTDREMLDINSDGYCNIIKQLSRLECKKYIHIYMEKLKVATIELVRMRIKFEINMKNTDATYDIISNEFPGMRVSLHQKHGTLFGLNHGLYLESIPNEQTSIQSKLLILPHGKITALATPDYHSTVKIDVNGALRNPPFHVYCVDESCQQLVSRANNHSAWFYLAYLHALTSHGGPEPFTNLTGTDKALQILQSAFVWSSEPYDKEAFYILDAISKLSPEREYNRKNGIKSVLWPNEVNSHAAHDAFVIIASKLVADSQRLRELHFQMDEQQLELKTNVNLNKKDYLRWLEFSPNLRITDAFIKHGVLKTTQSCFDEEWPHFDNTRAVSALYHEDEFHVSNNFDLKTFLFQNDKLDVVSHSTKNILNHTNKTNFVNLWISLYKNVREKKFSQEEFALIFSLLAHNGNSIDAILALQTVHRNLSSFSLIDPPNVAQYNLDDLNYDSSKVRDVLKSHHTYPGDYKKKSLSFKANYEKELNNIHQNVTDAITKMWPCDQIDGSNNLNSVFKGKIDSIPIKTVNKRLLNWNNNRKLLVFIEQISRQLSLLKHENAFIDNLPVWKTVSQTKACWQKFSIDFESKLCEQVGQYEAEIEAAKNIYFNGSSHDTVQSEHWWNLFLEITHSSSAQHLIDAQIYPRLVKSLMLPKLLSPTMNNDLSSVIGAFAITLAHEQRERRIIKFKEQKQEQALKRETENILHSNWSPRDYPQWLLFEIEQDLSIRNVQIEIAKRMMDPPSINNNTQHSVMQLNMGEGKTAVITPILASVLSDDQKVCQVTVLKSLYTTNLKSLRQSLGGMLNRRVYTFPCRRDLPMADYIELIYTIFEECKRKRGVILTVPEFRLSFQLKIYEMVCKQKMKAAKTFLYVHKWINAYVRSILDESDAILQAKHQLIYTVGDQLSLDGGSTRWIVVQALLKRIPEQMKRLHTKHGDIKIEFDVNYLGNKQIYGADVVKSRSDVFTSCRLLDDSLYDELKDALIDDFLCGKMDLIFLEITPIDKPKIKRMLSDKDIDKTSYDQVLNEFPIEKQHILLILGGLLRFEVLRLILTKRWRINYGVNEKSQRKMAVPFKAKDVAAEMTEFGHNDVAISFTHLSYYYSGLTNAQLYQVFEILKTKENKSDIYEKWIKSVSKELQRETLLWYTGINLADSKQRDFLVFPLFRYNMYVIDYWLANAVFPREAKTFEKKLMCTAWDLCSEHMKHTVSGFSGTNDTKNILPMTIAQNDLPLLERTNENVRKTLLQNENQAYRCLPANVSGKSILRMLSEQRIPVLLDCGALILELNNEQVVKEWLKLVSAHEFDAAIYFDARDVLMTVDRNDIKSEFDCSVYRDKMDHCLVYLDDVHTRGTDLKFPLGTKACVTLCGDITRDKTVQACMRMRLLGDGHSIAFWASFEADIRIRTDCQLESTASPTNEHVIRFISNNSEKLEKENIVHWTAAAYNYTKKLAAHKLHENSVDENAIQKLGEECFDEEFVSLHELYGGKDGALTSEISKSNFDKLAREYQNQAAINNFIDTIKKGVDQKIMKYIPHLKRYTGLLDEEQEKELEQELEEYRQVERPSTARPCTPQFDPYLKQLVQYGAMHSSRFQLKSSGSILELPMAYKKAKIFEKFVEAGISAWPEHIYVTKDFVRVIFGNEYSWENYLRPTWWIAHIHNTLGKNLILLISSFECNELLPTFRKSGNAALHMYRPRISQFHDNLLHNQQLCVTGAEENKEIDLNDEVTINVFAGAQYFASHEEQDAYCGFLGLIPRPRTQNLEIAFENGLIDPNGFVPMENRQHSNDIAHCVGKCKFHQNPVALVIQIIETHSKIFSTQSNVASILQKGIKSYQDSDLSNG